MSDNEDEKVGYGRPPQKTRFKAGLSGNPKGRPKGARNFATVLSDELNSQIPVSENGKRRRITKRQAIGKQLVNRAVSGDPKALPILFNEIRAHETEAAAAAPAAQPRWEDQDVMTSILRRWQLAAPVGARKGEPGAEAPSETSVTDSVQDTEQAKNDPEKDPH